MKTPLNKYLVCTMIFLVAFGCKNTILPISDHREYIISRDNGDFKGKASDYKTYECDSLWIFESELYRCSRFVSAIEEPFLTNDLEECNPGSPSYTEVYFTVFKFKLISGESIYHLSTAKLGEQTLSSQKSLPFIESNIPLDTRQQLTYSPETETKFEKVFRNESREYINLLLEYTGTQSRGYTSDALNSIEVTKKTVSKKWFSSGGRFKSKFVENQNLRFEYQGVGNQDSSFVLRNIIILHPTKIGNDKAIIMNIDTLTEMRDLRFDLVASNFGRDSIVLPRVTTD